MDLPIPRVSGIIMGGVVVVVVVKSQITWTILYVFSFTE